MKRNGIFTVLIVIVVLGIVVFRSTRRSSPATSPKNAVTQTLDGQTWSLNDQHGKVVLLDFWATWCPACVASMPEMKTIYDRFKDNKDFVMAGVSQDNSPADVKKFLESTPFPWTQLIDTHGSGLLPIFGVNMLPTVILIDRQGNIAATDLPHDELPTSIETLLAKP